MGRPRPPDPQIRSRFRPRRGRKPGGRLGLWTGLAVVVLLLGYGGVIAASQPHVDGDELSLTTFLELAAQGRVSDATILDFDSYVVGRYVRTDGTARPYNTPFLKDTREPLVRVLVDGRIPTTIDQQNGKRAVSLASILLPALVVTILFVYLIVSFRRGTGLFGVRSGARRLADEAPRVTFADVAGQDAAVAELREVTAYLADPGRFAAVGAAVPRGVLLYGPPGCGKTLLARAVAGEVQASFWSISGSDFVELYVGVGAARVRDLFAQARRHAPAVVFVDELDAVGRARATGGGPVAGQGEQEQALNQLLAELDGFSPSDGILVLGATNRPDVLDPALLRPGRFDRSVGLERPGEAARLAILELHARHRPLEPGADLAGVARRAVGLTGADLASVLNEAAFLAARAERTTISPLDLDRALERILGAPERQRRLALRDRSVGRRFSGEDRASFADVAGAGEAVAELAEIRDYLADPDRFRALGARVPRGILLSGPPGCGKTLLARAVAGEANAAFFSVAASEFVSLYSGAGAGRLRDLFAEARSMAPAIVFIDEIDSLGGRRTAAGAELNAERDQTLNQLLVELDGFDTGASVLVMAATNRPDLLDPALVRPGRFDRHVAVALPDREGRRAILALHARATRLAPGADLAAVAAATPGFSGADLANVVNEAALLAARRGLDEVPGDLLDEAVERTLLGVASRATVLAVDERRLVAYHEAGHALVALRLHGAVHKVSIIARGGSLGRCTFVDPDDRHVQSRSALLDLLAVGLAGRAAEELVFGEPGSAAAGDLRRVGELARRMAAELGMSPAVGPLAVGDGGWQPSEQARRLVDSEAQRIAGEAAARARQVLEASRPALDRLAAALLEHETLGAGEVAAVAGATPLADRQATRAGAGEAPAAGEGEGV